MNGGGSVYVLETPKILAFFELYFDFQKAESAS